MHYDVVIVGAGLSGIGAAWRLQQTNPGLSYAIVEARDAIGGTWDLFRYPGVRSDSDMFTLSYPFRPWRGAESLASGSSIRDYISDTAREGGIVPHIRFGTRVLSADWSSSSARWTLDCSGGQPPETVVPGRSSGPTQKTGGGGPRPTVRITCDFLYVCTGYYRYDEGYQPDFPGLDDYRGRFVHPQFWPDDLDYDDKRIIVVGSGATAVTLVPELARRARHVTMLQRSPTYLTVLPRRDAIADALRRTLPARTANRLIRGKNVLLAQGFYQLARRRPNVVRKLLRAVAVRSLGDADYVDRHFKPRYEPWDQRLCVIPAGDLYTAIRSGRADVVTDRIVGFEETGIRLASGELREADIVVSATGLELIPCGGMTISIDERPVEIGQRGAYRGLMLSGVPNLAYCIGYTNASWTLRADLSSRYVGRLLAHMRRHGYAVATPKTPGGRGRPLLDLTSGYVRRALDDFPRQGDRDPWLVRQNYLRDILTAPRADVTRDMTFTTYEEIAA